MFSIYLKEINQFFGSAIGYLVALVFFVALALFLVIAPNADNIIYNGYATLSNMFELAPWLYIFLVPAISMRLISEERKSGTMELLLIRRLSVMQIVLAKYLAGLTLVLLTIVPTVVYVGIIWHLGMPEGNLDLGSTIGSYIGLLFIAALYMAIGIYASSITSSQIVAFIIALVLCYVLYSGFDVIGQIPALQNYQSIIEELGISAHYSSISRGVIDSRDCIYFISLTAMFLVITQWQCKKSK